MNKNIKKLTRKFFNDFDIKEVTEDSLRAVIKKQGYTIVEFNNILNEKDVESLIESLELSDITAHSKGFTYADSKRRLVFIHEDLSEEETLMVLAHEEGHIYLNHLSSVPVLGNDVVEEFEANEFVHYLFNPGKAMKISGTLKRHKKALISVLCAVILVSVSVFTIGFISKEQNYYGKYYITSTGNKYHKKDCIFIKNKDNISRLTKEQYESGEYERCNICLPD